MTGLVFGEPQPVAFGAIARWLRDSFRLTVRKPLYWLPLGVFMFVWAFAVTYVPVAGNYLRVFLAGFYGAFLVALAHTQWSEGRISAKRAWTLLAPVLGKVAVLCLLDVAIFAFVDLPAIRLIATDREFEVYAMSRLSNGTARPIVDLVHTVVLTFASLPLSFAIPLVMLAGNTVPEAIRKSLVAFALSWPVYLAYISLTLVLPHALPSVVGLAGVAVFIVVVLFLSPVGYLQFAAAFGERVERPLAVRGLSA